MDPLIDLESAVDQTLADFLAQTSFASRGAVMTDLDGTAVHEHQGRIVIPSTVSHGLTELRRLGKPIVLNSLRFPLNVIETFGREWYAISAAPLPLVSLNGSVVGHLREGAGGAIEFQEAFAVPVPVATCEAVLRDLERLLATQGKVDVVLFYYPRDWREGERLWTPDPSRRDALLAKYASARAVTSEPIDQLAAILAASEPCMLLVLVDAAHDELMAYQHARPNQFVTAPGVDKSSGAEAAARLVGFDLEASVGAGDTPMDSFLSNVGLALRVGTRVLPYAGRHATLGVTDSLALGELWFKLADQLRQGSA